MSPRMRGMEMDDAQGKIYDSKLVKRMFYYAKPYYKYMFLAFLCVIIAAATQIGMPYITKIGIDRYIIFNDRVIHTDRMSQEERDSAFSLYKDVLREVNSSTYIVNPDDIDMADAAMWEKSGYMDSLRVYTVDTLENPSVAGIIRKNDDLFQSTTSEGLFYINISELGKLDFDALRVLRAGDMDGIINVGILYFVILIFSFGITFAQIYLLAWVGQRIMKDIRLDLFEHMQNLSLSYFDSNPIGRLVTRATNDVNAINEMFTSVAVNLFRDIFMFIGITFIIFKMNYRLASVLMITLPFMIAATILFRYKIRKAYRVVRKKLAEINATLSEHFAGIKTIKLFSREKENIKRFENLNNEYYKANIRQLYVHATFRPTLTLMNNIGIALIIWYGGGQVVQSAITVGALVAFLSYVRMFFQPIMGLAEKFNIMQSAMAASERIIQILDREPAIQSPDNPVEIEHVKGSLEFENVWFSYSGEESDWILKDISFKVAPGETIALVGETGAGKTTITSLLPRFYDIQKGSIKLDGTDIREWDLMSLRKNIGIVLQDVFIFASSIAGNIRLNRDDISFDDVQKAAEYVNAHNFIKYLPKGYEEIMHERGSTLSTGQKQLLAFARVFAFDPRILILDEATSNIDTETEKLIQDALLKLMKGRTSVIVAHRLSTIKHADRILVLHKGKIVEEGNHQELLAKRGIYYNLYLLQYADQE